MARDERFTFLIDRDERRMITALAKHLRRTESDAVRFVVIEAARVLESETQQVNTSAQAAQAVQHGKQ
jgi:hypothetical protein